jgi:hypothetical protein
MTQRYAVQNRNSGQLIDYCETREQALNWLTSYPVELVEVAKASKVVVEYTELSGPWGYGHQEESFCTYGGLLPCVRRLIKWMQSIASTFGPDARDIKDFFRHCRLYVNGEDKSEWLFKQVSKLDLKALYV